MWVNVRKNTGVLRNNAHKGRDNWSNIAQWQRQCIKCGTLVKRYNTDNTRRNAEQLKSRGVLVEALRNQLRLSHQLFRKRIAAMNLNGLNFNLFVPPTESCTIKFRYNPRGLLNRVCRRTV